MLAEKGTEIKVVYKDYPLAYHDDARKAAEAAGCAAEQNVFKEYQEQLLNDILQLFNKG